MATGLTNYQCPACTGPLHYDGASGKLKCEYCESTFDVAEIEKLYKEKEQESVKAQEKKEKEDESFGQKREDNLKAYNCSSCGAELICDQNTVATSCPYCGNPTIVPSQLKDKFEPDLIIPFKLDKKAATDALKKYYKGKKFLPNAFSDKNHIEEIKGVYAPFWLYDCEATGNMSFNAEMIRTWIEGDYQVTETKHFIVNREGSLLFEKVPVDSSTKMPDAHMDAIEPFDYSEMKKFSTAYLPGYYADRYDVDEDTCAKRLETRAKTSVEQEIRSTVVGYSAAIPTSSNFGIKRAKAKFVLIPVWLLSTKWNGQNFLFAMNGQTGKFIGDLPVDKGKYIKTLLAIGLPLAAVLGALIGFFMG